ncbi:hypothetical protein HIM_04541 [Hirsutella minnesotensis 3608]|uniref:DUF7582 domain-containing protein n=1 Tax=Hirsutella minnesotensis 3608 TaxID=1043627 RepID=A0A0F7ZPU0_9HYPO|nr:hypothetical protein HIM_04541 [Hirsutella minnesotensis 3608]
MVVSKDLISPPLEAGPPILDAHQLPPQLHDALEFVSTRLAKKSVHVSLVLVRKDYQLPSVSPPLNPKTSRSGSLATLQTSPPESQLPSRFAGPSSSGPVGAIKQLVRTASRRCSLPIRRPSRGRQGSQGSQGSQASGISSLAAADFPSSPRLSTPALLSSVPSSTSYDSRRRDASALFGVGLVHAPGLSSRAYKALCAIMARADEKFAIGGSWFSQPLSPAACGLPGQLFYSSLVQREVLFVSEGLTLVSLDRFWSLKCALSNYSLTRKSLRLEDAVDDLHRLVLANDGVKASREDILGSYEWLHVSDEAIADLNRTYRQAYGGQEQVGAIAGMSDDVVDIDCMPWYDSSSDDESAMPHPEEIGVAVTTPTAEAHYPVPRSLRLETKIADKPPTIDIPLLWQYGVADECKGTSNDAVQTTYSFYNPWMDSPTKRDIDIEFLDPIANFPLPGRGPLTPNDYCDITPTTRNEWGFLIGHSALRSGNGRTVAVETC